MYFKHEQAISTLSGRPLKLVDKFTYLGRSILSIESDVNIRFAKAWIAIDRLSIVLQFSLTNRIKWDFFKAVVSTILLYGCTMWMLTKHTKKKLDRIFIRMLCAVLTNPGSSTLQNSSVKAPNFPSHKPFK